MIIAIIIPRVSFLLYYVLFIALTTNYYKVYINKYISDLIDHQYIHCGVI
jgi:hypothetical protein